MATNQCAVRSTIDELITVLEAMGVIMFEGFNEENDKIIDQYAKRIANFSNKIVKENDIKSVLIDKDI